jgi:Zn-finger nucleic acid-binding protein
MNAVAPFKCPRCNVELNVGRAPDMTMHACARCGGLWLDNENTGIALKGLSQPTKDMIVQITSNAQAEVDKTPLVQCPVCAKTLDRMQRFGVEVDICGEHGTWFDRTELYRLAQASAAPPPAPRPIPPAMPPMQYAPSMANMGGSFSGLAIAGFICSFFCGLLGLILSIMAYNQINRSGNRIGGKGLAVAGVIISVLNIGLGIMIRLANARY